MSPNPPSRTPSPTRWAGAHREALADFLRRETTGGRLLLLATLVALVWANLAHDSYRAVWDAHAAVGPDWLHLDGSLADWTADGLLAIFFFVAGMEVKRELTLGELSERRAAALPFLAAAGGMVAPALVAIAVSGGDAAAGGAWAIPVATDIAFALGVLALAGSGLPPGVRVLLLSMAVIDDLGAITLVAFLFTDGLGLAWLAGGIGMAALYAAAFRFRLDSPWLLWGIAIATWTAIHASGIHATVAGILLGLLTPVRARPGEEASPVERFEHRLHPVSAGLVVPVFALGAAGIGVAALSDATGDAIAVGVFGGLLAGKVIGIYGGARLAVGLGIGALPPRVTWNDVVPVAVLGAIGYTVSLLITGLALDDAAAQERSAAAVLAASAVASVAAVVLLRRRPGRRQRAHPPRAG